MWRGVRADGPTATSRLAGGTIGEVITGMSEGGPVAPSCADVCWPVARPGV